MSKFKHLKAFESFDEDRDQVRYYLLWKEYLTRDEFIQRCKRSLENHNNIYGGGQSNLISSLRVEELEDKFEIIEDFFLELDPRFQIDFNFVSGKTSYFGVLLTDKEYNIRESTQNLVDRIQKSYANFDYKKMKYIYTGWDKLSFQFYL